MSTESQVESQHHELGPSGLKWVELCPGWRSSNETNPMAEEGTLLHKACETGNMDGLTDDQMRMVAVCLDYRDNLAKDADEMILERRLVIEP